MLLGTVLAQTARSAFPRHGLHRSRTRRGFAWFMGLWAGIATMVANAAGPVFGLYLLSLALPKEQMVGTSAWFFLIINVLKLPFLGQPRSAARKPSLALDLALCPVVVLGTLAGRRLLTKIPQKHFETLLLGSAAVAALKLAF
jgi:uncharacterized protein